MLLSTGYATPGEIDCIHSTELNQPLPAIDPVDKIFKEFFDMPGILEVGDCAQNIRKFIYLLTARKIELTPENSRVLFIYNYNPTFPPPVVAPNLVHVHERTENAHAYFYHVVLEVNGKIYDPAFGDVPEILEKSDFFLKRYLSREPITFVNWGEAANAVGEERYLHKLNTYRFTQRSDLLDDVRVRAMPIPQYINKFLPKLDRNEASPTFYWINAEAIVGSSPLREYLSPDWSPPPTRPEAEKEEIPSMEHIMVTPNGNTFLHVTDRPSEVFLNGVEVYTDELSLVEGEISQYPNAVKVFRPGPYKSKVVEFNRTDRSLNELQKENYPKDLLDPEKLKGKIILDMAAGGGHFVDELRNLGITAYALEIALNERQKKRLYASQSTWKSSSPIVLLPHPLRDQTYIEADAFHPGIADEQADVIYDTYGIKYHTWTSEPNWLAEYRAMLLRWRKILKPGGVILIAPFNHAEESLTPFHGLEGLEIQPALGNVLKLKRID